MKTAAITSPPVLGMSLALQRKRRVSDAVLPGAARELSQLNSPAAGRVRALVTHVTGNK